MHGRLACTCACGVPAVKLWEHQFVPTSRPLFRHAQVCERTAADKKGGHLCQRKADGGWGLQSEEGWAAPCLSSGAHTPMRTKACPACA